MTDRSVLLVIDKFGSGGAQTQIALLAAGLRAKGIPVSLLTYHPGDPGPLMKYLRGVELLHIPKSDRLGLGVIWCLASLLKQGRYSDVIAFLEGPSFYAEIAKALSGFKGKLLAGERNVFPDGTPRFRDHITRFAHLLADSVVCNSNTQKRNIDRHMPFLRQRTCFIANAVDGDAFRPIRLERRTSTTRRIIGIGRVVKAKNILGLIEASAIMQSRGIENFEVVWFGKIHDTNYFQRCQEAIIGLGLSSVWKWAGETDSIATEYAAADILVLPSYQEGMPNVVAEAFASGLLCVFSEVADAGWLSDDGRRALTFDPLKAHQIADALVATIMLPESDKKLIRERAHRFAVDELSLEKMTSRYITLLGAV